MQQSEYWTVFEMALAFVIVFLSLIGVVVIARQLYKSKNNDTHRKRH